MAQLVACPECQKHLQVPDELLGKRVQCPECKHTFTATVAEVGKAPPQAAYIVLTHSHALDFSLCEAVLRRGDFAYLGLIGSKTKRRRFERGWRELGLPERAIRRLVCPIGGDALRDKRPPVIAALTAAELAVRLLAPQPLETVS